MVSKTEPPATPLAGSFDSEQTSLVDLVDRLLGKGVVVDGEVVLGLVGVDLIYLRLAALLAAADRVRSGGTVLPPKGDGERAAVDSGAGHVEQRFSPAEGSSEGPPHARSEEPLHSRSEDGEPEGIHVRAAPDEALRPDSAAPVSRWNPDPEEVRKGVMKLVLALAEFIKQLLERQAIRRMEAGTLTEDETDRLGTALAQVEETLREMAERTGLDPDDLNLDLGPLGKLV
jgi:hypothetical protein